MICCTTLPIKFRPFASVKFSHTARIYFVVSPCIHSVPPTESSYCLARSVIMPALMKLIGHCHARLFPAYLPFKIHAILSELFCSPCARADSSTICCADSPPCPYRLNLAALSHSVLLRPLALLNLPFRRHGSLFRASLACICTINLTALPRLYQ